MQIDTSGIVVVVGNFGSGKTEVAVNLAVYRRRQGLAVSIADLDLVNPYFRTREAHAALTALGIAVVLPDMAYRHADLPILVPQVAGMIQQPSDLTLLDVGGNDIGATVLAALADAFRQQTVQTLQVVNPFRPETDSLDGCRKMRRQIEAASHLKIDGLIGNANLMEETTPETIWHGYGFMRDLAGATGLPLAFITAEERLLPELDADRLECPLLPIRRQLVFPWQRALRMTP